MAINRFEFHPALRSYDESWLSMRSGWFNFFFPANERIGWWGDIQLRCREQDYQHVLDTVPCPTTPDANGNGRYCALVGSDLDAYRLQVRLWLECFDEAGKQIAGYVAPAPIQPTVNDNITIGPKPSKRAAWFKRAKPK